MQTKLRKSNTSFSKIYFWTATIHNWLPLLDDDDNKQIIFDSLKFLSTKELITVYAFVIMPTHIHLIWQLNDFNGKESPKSSFMKYTAHLYLRKMIASGKSEPYQVNEANKKHEFWQRDSLGIEIYSKKIATQKLNYIHRNPIKGKWNLAPSEIEYPFSSASFYHDGIDKFGFLKNIFEFL